MMPPRKRTTIALALILPVICLVVVIGSAGAGAAATRGNQGSNTTAVRHCLSDIYSSYRIVNAHMQYAGVLAHQFAVFQAEVGSVECPGITRVLSGEFQLKKRGWINMLDINGPLHPPKIPWHGIYSEGDQPGLADDFFLNSHSFKIFNWEPGNKVRYVMRFQGRDQATGKILGTRIRYFPVGISKGRYEHWANADPEPEF